MISSETLKHVYTQGGGTPQTEWPFTFPILTTDGSDIFVYLTNPITGITTLLTSNYTVDIPNSQIIYPTVTDPLQDPLPADWKLTLLRTENITQLLDLITGGNFNADNLEDALDKIIAICQQINERVNRCIVQDVTKDTQYALPSDFELSQDTAASIVAAESALAAAASAANAEGYYQDAVAQAAAALASAAATEEAKDAAEAFLDILPEITASDALKIVRVNLAKTAFELTAGNAANAPAVCNANGQVPVANLGTGTPDSTKFLKGDGTWVADSPLTRRVVYTSGNNVWACPAGVTLAFITAVGGGAGGGGGNNGGGGYAPSASGGGAGASCARVAIVVAEGNYTANVGAGGAGGAWSEDGADGGDTVFGSITVPGGNKGLQAVYTEYVVGGTGGEVHVPTYNGSSDDGAAGEGYYGTCKITAGGNGGNGSPSNAGGGGGGNDFGMGGAGGAQSGTINTNSGASAALGYGGGGGGAGGSASGSDPTPADAVGGSGKGGIIIIEY